ncbi:MAG: hypothetical protein ABFC94_07260 [Syntrophomonas sp.]
MSNKLIGKCRRIIGNFKAMEYKPEYYRWNLNNRAYIKNKSRPYAMGRQKCKNE